MSSTPSYAVWAAIGALRLRCGSHRSPRGVGASSSGRRWSCGGSPRIPGCGCRSCSAGGGWAGIFSPAEGAPQPQPDVTGHDTTGVHALGMGTGVKEQEREANAGGREALPDLKPWREVGWIFRDGRCVAIERRGDVTRARIRSVLNRDHP